MFIEPMFLWWCPCCPEKKRWFAGTTQDRIDHMAMHRAQIDDIKKDLRWYDRR